MKPSLIALFTLFAFIASSAKAGVIIDFDLDPVNNGAAYYIKPVISTSISGLTLAKTGNETCPLSVKPYTLPHTKSDLILWKISSPAKISFITTNIEVNFFAVGGPLPSCVPSPSSWTIVEEEDGVKSVKISGYKNTVKGVFKIQKYTRSAYKIVFCPTDGDSCGAIGLSSRGLVITDETPLGFNFAKPQYYVMSKQVINNVLEA